MVTLLVCVCLSKWLHLKGNVRMKENVLIINNWRIEFSKAEGHYGCFCKGQLLNIFQY